jgi:predicted acetyltransferase
MMLVQPTLEMKEAFLAYEEEWRHNDEKMVPYSARLLGHEYEEWLRNISDKEIYHEGFVPSHTYFFMDEQHNIIGAINIRHYLNDYLLSYGGHIGYGIRPTQRKKGYAVQMLSMALPIAKELGIEKALLTCDKENIASAKTIQKNGGILENEVIEEGKMIQRYWIDLSLLRKV